MRASISFFHLFVEAVRIVFQSKLLSIVSILFGVLLFWSLQVSNSIAVLFPQDLSSPTVFLTVFKTHSSTLASSFVLIIGIGVVRTMLRGPLFLSIERLIIERVSPTLSLPSPKHTILIRAASLSLLFETTYWFAIIILGSVLLSPLLVAAQFNPAAMTSLFQMAVIFLLILSIVFFYMKEFGLLYTLLAHLKFRTALELGLKLFKKHVVLSLLFGLFIVLLTFLFTFFLNFAMITSALIPFLWLQEGVNTIASVLILGSTLILLETLRLLFFHALAATPRIKLPEAKKVLEEKQTQSGPSAI